MAHYTVFISSLSSLSSEFTKILVKYVMISVCFITKLGFLHEKSKKSLTG